MSLFASPSQIKSPRASTPGTPFFTPFASPTRSSSSISSSDSAHASPAHSSSPPRMRSLNISMDPSFRSTANDQFRHLYVLPVLLMEFLALALTRAVLPGLLLAHYGDKVYIVMGMAECIRGFLAFISCPIFGKVSDLIGRRLCLFITVAGTCAPVCSLALMFGTWGDDNATVSELSGIEESEETSSSALASLLGQASSSVQPDLHPFAVTMFVALLGLSGIFSSTFTIVFAYISDTVWEQEERVTAYGLALATFGLAFTIGPMVGGYIASQMGQQYVFICSFILTVLDLFYIYAILPESRDLQKLRKEEEEDHRGGTEGEKASVLASGLSVLQDANVSWNPWDTVRMVLVDPFLRKVGKVAFLYYTSLWAVISTLILYAAKRFEMGPERLGELMSALGLSTMVAEAVLVRIIVPMLGEKRAMRLGLAAFTLQCVVLGFAYEPWHLFTCAFFSLLGNLVYPSLSSMVSGSVEPAAVGEALGAINGIKALTEGVGPLIFGSLMTLSEGSALPGWPYLIAAAFAYASFQTSGNLPDIQQEEDDFIHELQGKERKEGEEYESLLSGDSSGSYNEDFDSSMLLSEIDSEMED